MNARNLKPAERETLLRPIRRDIAYLEKLLARMDDRGWDAACPFRAGAVEALRGVTAMRDELMRCESETLGSIGVIIKGLSKLNPPRGAKGL